jgi:hypothetical protein
MDIFHFVFSAYKPTKMIESYCETKLSISRKEMTKVDNNVPQNSRCC